MSEVIQFPDTFSNRVRLLAAALCGRRKSIQRREISVAAGRLNEELRCHGAERWHAVRLEDALIAEAYARLSELEGMDQTRPAPLLAFAVGGRP